MEKQQPRKAALLSIIPGLGQIYNKQKAKGLIFLGVTVLFVLYFLTLASPELSNLITLGVKPGRDNSLFMLIRGAFHSIFVVVYLLFYIFNIKAKSFAALFDKSLFTHRIFIRYKYKKILFGKDFITKSFIISILA